MRLVGWAAGGALLCALLSAGAQASALVYCAPEAPEGFDPARYIAQATLDASGETVYDRLVATAPGGTAIVPALAESWEVSKDGLQYLFHLRQGVSFHTTGYFTPTRGLTADDVVFSLARQNDPKNAWFGTGNGWPYFNAIGLADFIKSIDKIDDATVRIRLTRPDSGVLSDLAMDFASVVSKEYADALMKAKTPEQFDRMPIGTGPFKFVQATAERVDFAANPDYWGGAPPIGDLSFRIVADVKERLDRLQAGVCDVMGAPDAAAVKAAGADPALKVETAPGVDVVYLAVNTAKAPFGDQRVREALSLAIDRPAVADMVFGGLAVPARTIVPPALGSNAAPAEARNLDQARTLLDQAGAKDLKLTILTTAEARPNNPDPKRVADMVASDLAAAGVTATVESAAPLGEFLRKSTDKGRDSAVLFGWSGGNGDAADFLSMMLSCKAVGSSNRAEWCDKDFSALLDRAAVEPDAALRAQLVAAAESVAEAATPVIAITHGLVAVPMKKAIGGVVAEPLGFHNFARARVAD